MKKAEEIVSLLDLDFDCESNRGYYTSIIIKAIKLAQIDAIEEAVKRCADDAYCDLIHPYDEEYPDLEESEYKVIKGSILGVADQLKKEL